MPKPRLLFAPALLLSGAAFMPLPAPLWAQATRPATPVYPAVAVTPYRVGAFELALRSDTQTLARLSPAAEPGFDFVPGAREAERQGDGYNHIGDINLRLRTPGGAWRDFASAHVRKPIRALPVSGSVFAAADITASLGEGLPLRVERRWSDEGGSPVLRFTLVNTTPTPVEIGALGLPMVFDNLITDRSLEEAHAQASFVDPYIGLDAGYLQVTRLNGKGPALLVLPDGRTPLEAYRPLAQARGAAPDDLFTDKTARSQTAEGFYDWTIASRGFAEREWKNAGEQWNPPTSFTLAPGESRTIGLRFVQSPSIRAIENTLAAQQRPVAVGIPGYVVPQDLDATLFLKTPSPVARIESWPDGALAITPAAAARDWARYTIRGRNWGRARLAITYVDGTVQTISYYVTKPLERTMANLGHFSTTRQWFDDRNDPFHRGPGILTWDDEVEKIVTQDSRVWIAGMSDEGGGGSWVAAMMKQLDNPDAQEVARLERVVTETVVGHLQVATGEHAGGVRKSLFYYDPKLHPGYYDPKLDWRSWTSWSKKDSEDLGRSFNYPHVTIGHWVLYRLARNHVGLVKLRDWRWYLDHAYQTIVAMMRDAPYYTQFGNMEGNVFLDILADLRREGMTVRADTIETLMRGRAKHWASLTYPFGSEMAWDSTGQPEVYAWLRHFGYQRQADETREVVLGYDPAIPGWAYNGNARRYWDFLYGGKYPRIERQIHHYGSTNNALPLFEAYRQNPGDLHLLRVAYGGLMGGITNIDQKGFGSAAFHAWPDRMRWDPYSGDYGMGFFAHAYASATYVLKDPNFGWLSFGGNLSTATDGRVTIVPKDSARTRLFVAPAGNWITLQAGKIESVRYDPAQGSITLTLARATPDAPVARLYVEATTTGAKPLTAHGLATERGGYIVKLGTTPTTIRLTPN